MTTSQLTLLASRKNEYLWAVKILNKQAQFYYKSQTIKKIWQDCWDMSTAKILKYKSQKYIFILFFWCFCALVVVKIYHGVREGTLAHI